MFRSLAANCSRRAGEISSRQTTLLWFCPACNSIGRRSRRIPPSHIAREIDEKDVPRGPGSIKLPPRLDRRTFRLASVQIIYDLLLRIARVGEGASAAMLPKC